MTKRRVASVAGKVRDVDLLDFARIVARLEIKGDRDAALAAHGLRTFGQAASIGAA